jgi:chromosome segregation ATPase
MSKTISDGESATKARIAILTKEQSDVVCSLQVRIHESEAKLTEVMSVNEALKTSHLQELQNWSNKVEAAVTSLASVEEESKKESSRLNLALSDALSKVEEGLQVKVRLESEVQALQLQAKQNSETVEAMTLSLKNQEDASTLALNEKDAKIVSLESLIKELELSVKSAVSQVTSLNHDLESAKKAHEDEIIALRASHEETRASLVIAHENELKKQRQELEDEATSTRMALETKLQVRVRSTKYSSGTMNTSTLTITHAHLNTHLITHLNTHLNTHLITHLNTHLQCNRLRRRNALTKRRQKLQSRRKRH